MTETDASSDKQNDGLQHTSVLLKESLEYLNVRPGLTYVDATAGAGGHLLAIAKAQAAALDRQAHPGRHAAEAGDSTKSTDAYSTATTPGVIGIDRDKTTLSKLQLQLDESGPHSPVALYHANFSDIKSVVEEAGLHTITGGILADLGVSSMQIDDPERGFSFLKDDHSICEWMRPRA